MKKHTKEQCFKLVGYPEWWGDSHKQKSNQRFRSNGKGASATSVEGELIEKGQQESSKGFGGMAVTSDEKLIGKGFENYTSNPSLINFKFFPPNASLFDSINREGPNKPNENTRACHVQTSSHSRISKNWIFDCGATDTMSYDSKDFCTLSPQSKSHIETASGEIVEVKGGGSITFSNKMKINNCLYIPSLSSKLLSISQVTKQLNCVVLKYPTFCVLQDIRTKEIVGRGTERGGLYYFDEVVHKGHAMLAHGTTERQLWLWHRCLGHPSFSYLKTLFLSLFLNNSIHEKCETCILAKTHRASFNQSNTRVDSVFSLIHSDVWGPAPNSTNSMFKYFVLFVDDFSRMN